MAVTIVYSDKSDLACELISAVRAIGDYPTAVAINDEELAMILAGRGVKVLAIKGNNLTTSNTAALAWALKNAVDKTQASNVFLSSSLDLNRVARYLSEIMDAICLIDIDHVGTKRGRLVCERNSPWGTSMTSIELEKKGAVIALSSAAFPPATKCSGGSIEDIRINPALSEQLVEIRRKSSNRIAIEKNTMLIAGECD